MRLKPDSALFRNNLGVVLTALGLFDQAVREHQWAIRLQPNYPEAYFNLGNAQRGKREWEKAAAAYRSALQSNPSYALAHDNLGGVLKELGDVAGALACYRHASALAPESAAMHSNLVYAMLFDPRIGPAEIREECARWDERHAAPLRSAILPHVNRRERNRCLRVGYVSPNFSRHVISHFLVPLLESHGKADFQIFCYSSVRNPDDLTTRLKQSADVWRDVVGLNDDILANQIRTDEIDILVDLTQHMAENHLPLFARKPAPVQVAWLGYPGTTGLRTMDYRFTDAAMEPAGAVWSESVERPIRLPDSWFCFDPIKDYPDVGSLPRNGWDM